MSEQPSCSVILQEKPELSKRGERNGSTAKAGSKINTAKGK
jgi:hypothetical protein